MQVTFCKHTVAKSFNPESEQDRKALREFYKNKQNSLWNEKERIEKQMKSCQAMIDAIDKGIINDAMIGEFSKG